MGRLIEDRGHWVIIFNRIILFGDYPVAIFYPPEQGSIYIHSFIVYFEIPCTNEHEWWWMPIVQLNLTLGDKEFDERAEYLSVYETQTREL